MSHPTPRSIVEELDRYIIGQKEAKRALAIALCNRERRKKIPAEAGRNVIPKNIMLTGPTGVGKTEVARRLAEMVNAPFIKLEATKFTEVGYVGRDAESIIHDLVEVSANKVYQAKLQEVTTKAEKQAIERIVGYVCHQLGAKIKKLEMSSQQSASSTSSTRRSTRPTARMRQKVADLLQSNELEEQLIEIEVDSDFQAGGVFLPPTRGLEDIESFITEFDRSLKQYAGELRQRKVPVKEARRILAREEANKLIDFDELIDQAVTDTEETAVVFIDEVDKLIAPKMEMGRDVSGEGVQRDLLPIVEGTTVMTRYGSVNSNHILFIAAGTFSQSKPSDLIPEFQGRFPLRVDLTHLVQEDLERILVEPCDALTKQYQMLLDTEGVKLTFADDGIQEMARTAVLMNERLENIGARRLHTVVEKVLEDLNFTAPEMEGEEVVIDATYVSQRMDGSIKEENVSDYIM